MSFRKRAAVLCLWESSKSPEDNRGLLCAKVRAEPQMLILFHNAVSPLIIGKEQKPIFSLFFSNCWVESIENKNRKSAPRCSLHYFGVNAAIAFIAVPSFSLLYPPILRSQNNKCTDTLHLWQYPKHHGGENHGWLTIDWWFSSSLCYWWRLVNHFSGGFGQSATIHLQQSPHRQAGEESDGGKRKESCVGRQIYQNGTAWISIYCENNAEHRVSWCLF